MHHVVPDGELQHQGGGTCRGVRRGGGHRAALAEEVRLADERQGRLVVEAQQEAPVHGRRRDGGAVHPGRIGDRQAKPRLGEDLPGAVGGASCRHRHRGALGLVGADGLDEALRLADRLVPSGDVEVDAFLGPGVGPELDDLGPAGGSFLPQGGPGLIPRDEHAGGLGGRPFGRLGEEVRGPVAAGFGVGDDDRARTRDQPGRWVEGAAQGAEPRLHAGEGHPGRQPLQVRLPPRTWPFGAQVGVVPVLVLLEGQHRLVLAGLLLVAEQAAGRLHLLRAEQ